MKLSCNFYLDSDMYWTTGKRNFPSCIKIWYEYSYRVVTHHIGEDIYFLFSVVTYRIDPLKPELNPICYLLALLGAHHFLHVSGVRVKLLTFRLLMSYIYIYIYIYMYGAPILDVSRSHATTQHSR